LGDVLEFLGYFFSFWLFIGSRSFRERTLRHWRTMKPAWAVLFIPVEIASSLFCGILIPGYLFHMCVGGTI